MTMMATIDLRLPCGGIRRFWQVKNQGRNNSDLLASSNRTTPFSERTYPEITVMLGTDHVPTQIV